MNHFEQSKKIKPNAKNCKWCNNFDKCRENGFRFDLDKRQLKKLNKEGYRYCRAYKFSKQNFRKWKEEFNISTEPFVW